MQLSARKGFTLVELLVVMAIIGLLATLAAVSLRSTQVRGRDAQRKNDLRQIAEALELFFSDYGRYPDASTGRIAGCAYDPSTSSGTACTWGGEGVASEFRDVDSSGQTRTSYFKILPDDPSPGQDYYYRLVPSSGNKKFQLFARLENSKDPDCLGGDCANPTGVPGGVSCGTSSCNFAITSSNTTPTE